MKPRLEISGDALEKHMITLGVRRRRRRGDLFANTSTGVSSSTRFYYWRLVVSNDRRNRSLREGINDMT